MITERNYFALLRGYTMAGKSGGLKEWAIPFLFVLCAGWAI
ncbi:MAG: hypothetical protein ACI9JP_003511, partial [Granulosicoccus sp.]